RIELYDRRQVRLGAVVGAATLEYPNAFAVAIGLDRDYGSQLAAVRQLRPVLLHAVRVGRGIGIGRRLRERLTRRQRGGGDDGQSERGLHLLLHGLLPVFSP